MEPQKPDDPRKKTLDNPTAAAAAAKTSQQPAARESADAEPRKEGGEGAAQKASKAPSDVGAALLGSSAAVTEAVAGSVSDLEKKFRRAERFGMPVQLSEEEKRSSRAQRFGTGPTLLVGNDAGELEGQKRKARAERFGLVQHSPADEEVKKKARLERFGQNPKQDTLEEEKRKARAARFSLPSNASSEANGKAKSELMTATVAKAKGGS